MNAIDFEEWRRRARDGLNAGLSPERMSFSNEAGLFDEALVMPAREERFSISKEFLELAQTVACHRSGEQWSLLYQALWEITRGRRALLRDAAHPVVHRLEILSKQVRRDVHKMHAFVRFEKFRDDPEAFFAWYEPDHLILKNAASFFRKRFGTMNWAIFTPDGGVTWNQDELRFIAGPLKKPDRVGDAYNDLWRSYFASIFNPARLKINAMKREMPVRFWKNLPEADLIPDLIAAASGRVSQMIRASREQARPTPAHAPSPSIEALRENVKSCTSCELCLSKRPGVPSSGPLNEKIIVVGEQPGDQEDLQGKPFVGPAGQLLREVLREIGVDDQKVYLTNAVKHFRYQLQGKQRLHKRPDPAHITACRPWLDDEIRLFNPDTIVCLGATALHAVLGYALNVGEARERDDLKSLAGKRVVATYHPSALLRASAAQAQLWRAQMQRDLTKAFTVKD